MMDKSDFPQFPPHVAEVMAAAANLAEWYLQFWKEQQEAARREGWAVGEDNGGSLRAKSVVESLFAAQHSEVPPKCTSCVALLDRGQDSKKEFHTSQPSSRVNRHMIGCACEQCGGRDQT